MAKTSKKEATYTQRLSHEINAAYKAYKAGNPSAENALHRAFREQAANVLRHVFQPDDPDPSLEYEIANKAVLKLGQFRSKSELSTWFCRIAQNEANRALRAFIKRRDDQVSVDASLAAKASNQDIKLDLATLRGGLPPEQDEVLDLVAHGYSLGKIAKKLGKPLGTIRSRYRLAKEKMKRKNAK